MADADGKEREEREEEREAFIVDSPDQLPSVKSNNHSKLVPFSLK